MSDLSKTVEIIFSIDNQMDDALTSINNHIGTVDSSFGGLGGRAKDLAEDVALVGAATLALATAFATIASKEAAEFETAIAKINTILDETQANQLPAIKDGILELSEVLPKSAADLAAAFYDIQSGIPLGEEGLRLLEVAAKAATAGITDTQTAVSPFITVLNSYKLGAEDAERVSDIFFQTINHGVINFEQLASGIGSVASLAASLDQPIEEVGAAMIVLTKNTGQQEESFTRLTNTYNQLAQLDTAEKLKEFGVEVYDVTGKMNPLSDIIGQMSDKQMTYQDILSVFPEIRAAMGVNILVQDYDNLTKELDAVTNSQGATQAAFEKMMSTTESQIQLLKNSWDAFLISAGDPILEALGPVITKLNEELGSAEGRIVGSEIGEAIGNWVSAISDFITKLQEIYQEIEGVEGASMGVDFASWAGDIETIKSALTVANTLIQGVAMSVALVHDGFAGTGNVISGLYNVIETALYTPFFAVNELVIKILEGLDYIPGLDLTGPIEKLKTASEAMAKVIAEDLTATAPFEYWSDNVAKSIAVVDEAINQLGESGGDAGVKVAEGGDKATESISKLNTELVGSTEELAKAEKATTSKAEADKKATEELGKQVEALIEFKLGLEEIQSKERVSIFEIQANVDMAAMEQATEQFQTMFDSIADGMASTSETLLGLFGLMGTASQTPFGMEALLEAIEEEQALREKEFALQEKLIQAQIDYMNLKNQAMQSGEALINITADGLKPHLEAMWWEIMKEIQVRANAEGAEYLLGI